MKVTRHPALAADIKETALHYAEVSEPVLSAFWNELDQVLDSIERNPRIHHFDSSGLRRASFRRFPYHLLYQIEGDTLYLVVLRHDHRHPNFGLGRQFK